MVLTTINYEEPNQNKYYGIEVHYGNNEIKVFNSGDFVKDWAQSMKFKINELSDKEAFFIHSSSVNHFIMDGNRYEPCYLVFNEKDNPSLKFGDEISFKTKNTSIEFFVEEGERCTWKEFKKKYNQVIKSTEHEDSNNSPSPIASVSACCSSEMIPPDWDMVEQMGSLWKAYACYICKECGKVCEPVDAPQ